ncbi:hypothetical protein Cni_G19665 [Canna indica]|uniref:RSE1/DDB1/CPSF1 second beta-propeller domain-containing protein n=1 Tax=Canna indica TaxID=4628 RepID=A0AAQ3QIR2_9LILI|nr:hypothetical protein Cni_G19665 [Canna indica]
MASLNNFTLDPKGESREVLSRSSLISELVSQVYQSIKVKTLLNMIHFFDLSRVEKLSVDAVKYNFLAMKVDHLKGAVIFVDHPYVLAGLRNGILHCLEWPAIPAFLQTDPNRQGETKSSVPVFLHLVAIQHIGITPAVLVPLKDSLDVDIIVLSDRSWLLNTARHSLAYTYISFQPATHVTPVCSADCPKGILFVADNSLHLTCAFSSNFTQSATLSPTLSHVTRHHQIPCHFLFERLSRTFALTPIIPSLFPVPKSKTRASSGVMDSPSIFRASQTSSVPAPHQPCPSSAMAPPPKAADDLLAADLNQNRFIRSSMVPFISHPHQRGIGVLGCYVYLKGVMSSFLLKVALILLGHLTGMFVLQSPLMYIS